MSSNNPFDPERLRVTPERIAQMREEKVISERLATSGEYQTEDDSCARFDAVIESHPDLFQAIKEVKGWYAQPQFNTEVKDARIDRVLIPQPRLVKAGWVLGPIGVEIKRSNIKAGPAISQALDYSRCVFKIDRGSMPRIVLEWVFIWPIEKAYCDIGSIMTQNRIGCAFATHSGRLTFRTDSINLIVVNPDGTVSVTLPRCGRKRGSR